MTQKIVPQITMSTFASMDPKEARLRVARDVLDLLEAGAVIPITGKYIRKDIGRLDKPRPLHELVQHWLKQYEDNKMRACGVCALGAALVATVRRFNEVSVMDITGEGGGVGNCRRGLSLYLERIFTRVQLNMIEIAFEGTTGVLPDDEVLALSDHELLRAQRFNDADVTEDVTFRRIFENIIANDGTFVP